ncbi:hypothetical protein, partial [Enterobacter hormaechei]|uniref:hypothetical protein n=3 Tax=Enterobacteriaceae TaxID=543 RepID=UPI00203A6808
LVQGCAPKPSNNLSATGYHPMPSEYDEQRDSTDTQLPGEYDLFDLMAQVTNDLVHARMNGLFFRTTGKLQKDYKS